MINTAVIYVLLTLVYLPTGNGAVTGYAEYKTLEECKAVVKDSAKNFPKAVATCVAVVKS